MATKFNTVPWAFGSNIYEVNIRQYTPEGTFAAFAKHLPRLKEMGVKTLWLMPITPISKKNRLGTLGSYYACSSYVGINPEFGTLADFKQLVDKAHQLDFKLIIDWVANHTGCDHEWTIDNPHFYQLDSHGHFTERNGWKDVIDLNFSNKQMRQELINSMRFWVKEFNIDGFRCDMAHLVPLDFWMDARTQCDAIKPLFWLAECEEVVYHDVFDATYAWQWMHASEQLAKSQTNLTHIYNILHGYSQYPGQSLKLFYTANHDENSWNGTEYEKYGLAVESYAVFCATWSGGIPLVYSGQEVPNKKRLAFFQKDEIEWPAHLKLQSFYQTLLNLHQTKVIAKGETFILPTHNNYVMAYLRKYENETILVLINFHGESKLKLSVEHQWLNGMFTNVFSGFSYDFKSGETFELMGYDYMIYQKVEAPSL